MLMVAVGYGTRHSFPVFFGVILDEFGWSRAQTASILSLAILVYGLTSPLAGILSDKFGPRRVVPIAALLLGLSVAACSQASQLWHFYLLYGFAAPIAMACSGYPVLAPVIANWFTRRRGTALGIFQVGLGLSFLVGTLAQYFILNIGWQLAYVAIGAMIVIVVVPLALVFLRARPQDMGLEPDGVSNRGSAQGQRQETLVVDKTWASIEWSLPLAMRTYRFWMVFMAQLLFWGLGVYGVLGHHIRFAVDMGFDPLFAAGVGSTVYGLATAIGMGSGFISDRLGRERTYTLGVAGAIAALVTLLMIRDASMPSLFYLYAILLGYFGGLVGPTLTAAAADLFQGKNFGAIIGAVSAGWGIGGLIGPWLAGYIYDTTGSYSPAFIISIAAFAAAGLCMWIAAPRKIRRVRPAS